jgi:ribonuclease HI
MGTWMQNFAVNTGICTSVRAELWAVVTGLDLAWTLGLCQVILDTDSILVVGLITKSTTKSDSNNALITQVKEALAREWGNQRSTYTSGGEYSSRLVGQLRLDKKSFH